MTISIKTSTRKGLPKAVRALICATVLALPASIALAGDKPATEAATIVTNDTKTAEANKALVLEFYQRVFGDKDLSAIDEYLAEDYIQHNPNAPTGRAAIKQIFSGMLAKMPDVPKTKVDIRRSAAEGDLVWLHVRSVMPDGTLVAIVDIFRVENGRIAEHWDVVQPVPEKSANDNGMF